MRLSKKAAKKRKEERKDFPEFFQRHIQIIKDNKLCCEECGARLQGHVSEIAHVLPKSTHKVVACEDLNVAYLCGMFSDNQCHSNLDNSSIEKIKKMNIYYRLKDKVEAILEKYHIKLSFKESDKWDL